METIESVFDYVSSKIEFPIKSKLIQVLELSGGSVNYVYRLKFEDETSYVLKQFPSFLSVHKALPVSPKRYMVEKAALEVFNDQPWRLKKTDSILRTPKLIFSDDDSKVLLMEDAGQDAKLFVNLLKENSGLDLKYANLLAKEIKNFMDFIAMDFGISPETHEIFKNESAWEIISGYFTLSWFHQANMLKMEKEFEPYLSKAKELTIKSKDDVFLLGDLSVNSILIDQVNNLIWIVDWEMARFDKKTRDFEQIMSNLWMMQYQPNFDSKLINEFIRNFQLEFFGDESSDWRKNLDFMGKCNFIFWTLFQMNLSHLGIESNVEVAKIALKEIQELSK